MIKKIVICVLIVIFLISISIAQGLTPQEKCEIEDGGVWRANQCCKGIFQDSGTLTTTGEGLIGDKGKFICTRDVFNVWTYWLPTNFLGMAGNIYYIEYGNYEVISDNVKWSACDALNDGTGNFDENFGNIIKEGEKVTVSSHQYICYNNDGIEQFGECVGSGNSLNQEPAYGTVHSTGEIIKSTPISQTGYDFEWQVMTPGIQMLYDSGTTSIDTSATLTSLGTFGPVITTDACQICRTTRYWEEVWGRWHTIPISNCVNFNQELNTNFPVDMGAPYRGDQFNLNIINCPTKIENNCQICSRYADANGRDDIDNPPDWVCKDFGEELVTSFVGDVNADDDLDFKIECGYPVIEEEFQLCRRYADNNGRASASWECVNFGEELITDFVGDVNADDDFDLKIIAPETIYLGKTTNPNIKILFEEPPAPAGGPTPPPTPETLSETTTNPNALVYATVVSQPEIDPDYGKKYHCSQDFNWVENLDASNGPTCEISGLYEWTGSKCCGDDAPEFYNDIGWPNNPLASDYTIGGCFQNKKIETKTRTSDIQILKNNDFSNGITDWQATGSSIEAGQLRLLQGNAASQEVSNFIVPGKEYTLSAYLHPIDGTAVVSIFIDGVELEESKLAVIGFEEQTLLKTFIIPQDASEIKVQAYSEGPGNAFFDNIKLNFANANIMNLDGEFYGCNLDDTERASYNDLIPPENNKQLCEVLDDYFCGETTGWTKPLTVDTLERNETKETPSTYSQFSASCCPDTYCWNGNNCIPSETTAIPSNPIQEGDTQYICDDGNWYESALKCKWDDILDTDCGFCSSTLQCFTGTECIDSTEYDGEHYCDKGNWSTRTKFLAVELLKFVADHTSQSDYTLFCDDYKSTLNRYDYLTDQGDQVVDYIRGQIDGSPDFGTYPNPFANHFCVLRYDGDNILIGTSLNQPISEDPSFLELFEKDSTYCDTTIITNSIFSKCGVSDTTPNGDNTIWYNESLKLIIYNKQGVNLEDKSFWSHFFDLFLHPIQSLLRIINPKSPEGISLIYEPRDINRIYIDYHGGKSISAILESDATTPFLAINYTGFNQDICLAIDKYDDSKFGGGSIKCIKDGNQHHVYTQRSEALDLWQDLTSKTRTR